MGGSFARAEESFFPLSVTHPPAMLLRPWAFASSSSASAAARFAPRVASSQGSMRRAPPAASASAAAAAMEGEGIAASSATAIVRASFFSCTNDGASSPPAAAGVGIGEERFSAPREIFDFRIVEYSALDQPSSFARARSASFCSRGDMPSQPAISSALAKLNCFASAVSFANSLRDRNEFARPGALPVALLDLVFFFFFFFAATSFVGSGDAVATLSLSACTSVSCHGSAACAVSAGHSRS